ncbi:MAG: helix-turn-helix transcriptional regulator [Bacteroidetes bacterium]|nr:helix-turn-helix transcriptional regulator [Bacteroidota bacterium]
MFKETLRKYIEIKNITQSELASMVGDTQQAVSDFLNKEGNPQKKTREKYFEKLVGFENYYKQITSLNQVNDHDIEYDIIENTNGNKFVKLPDGSLMISVPLIPFNAYASFLEIYDDEYQVHEEFESIYFTVDKIGRGKYLAFTVKNDSMNGGSLDDTPSGAQVLTRELGRHHWKDGFKPTQYGWIIICLTGIFHKDIKGPDEHGFITCSSRNKSPEFPNFKLNLNDVHSIYKLIKRTF